MIIEENLNIFNFSLEILVASNEYLGRINSQANKDESKPLNNHFDGSLANNIRNFSEGDISIVGLKRRVGFISGTALIVGTMIGKFI